jgi:hypothetical protein
MSTPAARHSWCLPPIHTESWHRGENGTVSTNLCPNVPVLIPSPHRLGYHPGPGTLSPTNHGYRPYPPPSFFHACKAEGARRTTTHDPVHEWSAIHCLMWGSPCRWIRSPGAVGIILRYMLIADVAVRISVPLVAVMIQCEPPEHGCSGDDAECVSRCPFSRVVCTVYGVVLILFSFIRVGLRQLISVDRPCLESYLIYMATVFVLFVEWCIVSQGITAGMSDMQPPPHPDPMFLLIIWRFSLAWTTILLGVMICTFPRLGCCAVREVADQAEPYTSTGSSVGSSTGSMELSGVQMMPSKFTALHRQILRESTCPEPDAMLGPCVVCLEEMLPYELLHTCRSCSLAVHTECLLTWACWHWTCVHCRVDLGVPHFSKSPHRG